ncbi:hypothetical protein [Orientia tsutsugamushi]|nr:hypothetical protein [Orientia tsutsugamushi]KJV95087.1 hypothetical protein OTSUT76_0521 [Orientia tsutsugamushi str. UT76]
MIAAITGKKTANILKILKYLKIYNIADDNIKKIPGCNNIS